MLTVHKYPLPAHDCLVHMPLGAKVIHADIQGEQICLWAHVDTKQKKELRRFMIVGTGHTMPEGQKLEHRGTVLMHEGTLVVHVFENVDYTEHQRGVTN